MEIVPVPYTLVVPVSLVLLVAFFCSLARAVVTALGAGRAEHSRNGEDRCGQSLQRLLEDPEAALALITMIKTMAISCGAVYVGAAWATISGGARLAFFALLFTIAMLLVVELGATLAGSVWACRLGPAVALALTPLFAVCRPVLVPWRRLLQCKREEGTPCLENGQGAARRSRHEGGLSEHEEAVIGNIVNLKTKMVREVMTPRTVTFSLNEHLTVDSAINKLAELTVHSRIPIYHRSPGNVTGIVMRKDILQAAAVGKSSLTVAKFKRPAHFVPETARLNMVLVDFFDRRQHLFVVVDEYGTMTGIISLEDVIEEIVGREIVDESDKAKDMRELARTRNIESKRNLRRVQRAGPPSSPPSAAP